MIAIRNKVTLTVFASQTILNKWFMFETRLNTLKYFEVSRLSRSCCVYSHSANSTNISTIRYIVKQDVHLSTVCLFTNTYNTCPAKDIPGLTFDKHVTAYSGFGC